jgi:predicted GIY-YIG superfamily endonuclease
MTYIIMDNEWSAYIIVHPTDCTYVGVSPDVTRRLRQHNCEIKGGAKYTTSKTPHWKHACIISGFNDKIQAMQFEWALKHVIPRNAGGIKNRMNKLYRLFEKERWTSKSPLAVDIPLVVTYFIDLEYIPPQLPPHVTMVCGLNIDE